LSSVTCFIFHLYRHELQDSEVFSTFCISGNTVINVVHSYDVHCNMESFCSVQFPYFAVTLASVRMVSNNCWFS